MRIAYLCADPGVPVFGRKGCSVHVQEIIRAFRRRGAAVCLFAVRFDGDRPPDLDRLSVYRLSLPPGDTPDHREKACFAANTVLADALESEGPFNLVYERYS